MMNIDTQRLAREFKLPLSSTRRLQDDYTEQIKPQMKLLYLAHLVGAVESLINRKRITNAMGRIVNTEKAAVVAIERGNMRPYAIKLRPVQGYALPASVRGHDTGATIYYNPDNDEMIKRTAIAHELGHIFMQEYLQRDNTEEAADVFAFIAMQDKNNFYTDECPEYAASSIEELLGMVKHLHG